MSHLTGFSLATAAVNLSGSILSAIGSGFIIICYLFLPLKYHFRHVLILNLAVADLLNGLAASAGGVYILSHKRYLDRSPSCVFQGLAMQVTVQATDCAVLAIAVLTVYYTTRRTALASNDEWRTQQVILSCCAIWALPFFTGFLGLGLGLYAPATGNWCWIKSEPAYLRYVLTHGWRFLFIFIEICLYAYLYIWIRRYYRRMPSYPHPSQGSQPGFVVTEIGGESQQQSFDSLKGYKKPGSLSFPEPSSPIQMSGSRKVEPQSSSVVVGSNARYQAIQKMLLLNAYPLAYIALWIPGVVNRLIEATGHRSRVMQLMQASTQFIGLTNALTYGWNERVATQIRERYSQRSRGKRGAW